MRAIVPHHVLSTTSIGTARRFSIPRTLRRAPELNAQRR